MYRHQTHRHRAARNKACGADQIAGYGRHSVTVNGAPVELTYKEYSLLRLLLENTNLVVTRETILQVVWGTDISVESRTVDMHIRTLRKKLGDAGRYICTVRKVGYKLTDEEEAGEE